MGPYFENIYHISTTQKIKVPKIAETTGHQNLEIILCFVVYMVGPKQSSSPRAFMQNGILRWWNLDICWKSANLTT